MATFLPGPVGPPTGARPLRTPSVPSSTAPPPPAPAPPPPPPPIEPAGLSWTAIVVTLLGLVLVLLVVVVVVTVTFGATETQTLQQIKHQGKTGAQAVCHARANVPIYMDQSKCRPIYRFAVYVLTTNPAFTMDVIKDAFAFIHERTTQDFETDWGLGAEFHFFTPADQPPDWTLFVPIFIIDELIGSCGCASYHWFGNPVGAFVGAPVLPIQQPYEVVIIGTGSGDGVETLHGLRHPLYPLETLVGTFTFAAAGQMLNLMTDRFYGDTAFNVPPFSDVWDFYLKEVTSSYSAGPGYSTDNNAHTYPDYSLLTFYNGQLNSAGDAGPRPFDFKDLGPATLTPYQGFTLFYRVNLTSGDVLICEWFSPQATPLSVSLSCFIFSTPLSVLPLDSNFYQDAMRAQGPIYTPLPAAASAKRSAAADASDAELAAADFFSERNNGKLWFDMTPPQRGAHRSHPL